MKLVRTYYQTVDDDGDVWCQSRDPAEVVKRSEGRDYLLYQRMDVFEITEGWVSWTPDGGSAAPGTP